MEENNGKYYYIEKWIDSDKTFFAVIRGELNPINDTVKGIPDLTSSNRNSLVSKVNNSTAMFKYDYIVELELKNLDKLSKALLEQYTWDDEGKYVKKTIAKIKEFLEQK